MWTSTIDLDLKRVALTRLLGRVWPDAYFSSFAPLRVQNIVRASLAGANWVRVRNRLAGICGSDLHFVYSNGDLRIAPAALPGSRRLYPGHELLGEVIEVGEDVRHLNVGDRVALQYGPNCVSAGLLPLCHACASSQFALCERGAFPEPQQIGGGWSEEVLLHEGRLYRVASGVSDEQAVMIEPTAVALHAILRHPPQAGERVLIVGAGTIGLLTLHMLRTLFPQAEVSVLARHPFQIEQATRMGARHIIYPQDSYGGVQRATQARLYRGLLGNNMLMGGYDVIFDTVGRQQTLHHALRWAKARGTVVLVGLDLRFMRIDLSPIWYREVNLIGTFAHGSECWSSSGVERPRSTFSLVEDLIIQGKIHPEQLITHRFAINHHREALQTAHNKGQSRAIKVVFDYSLVPATVVPNVRASARKPRPSTRVPLTFDDITWEEDAFPPERQKSPVSADPSRLEEAETQPIAASPAPVRPVEMGHAELEIEKPMNQPVQPQLHEEETAPLVSQVVTTQQEREQQNEEDSVPEQDAESIEQEETVKQGAVEAVVSPQETGIEQEENSVQEDGGEQEEVNRQGDDGEQEEIGVGQEANNVEPWEPGAQEITSEEEMMAEQEEGGAQETGLEQEENDVQEVEETTKVQKENPVPVTKTPSSALLQENNMRARSGQHRPASRGTRRRKKR